MRRSIATVSLSGRLDEKLHAAAAARFDAVEVFENDLLFFDGSPREVRELAAALGLRIALYQPFRDFEAVPDEQFRRNLDRAERKFDVMAELGAPLMLVCSNVSPHALDDDARAAAQLHELAGRAARRGLRIGYEALAWGTRVATWRRAWTIVERAAHPHLGLIVDSFHTLAIGDDFAGIAELPGERIFFVQVADAPRLKLDALSWSRHFRCFPGQGALDVPGFLAAVLRAGYAGPVSLEVFNDDFRAAPSRATAQDGMRSLLLLEEGVRACLPARPRVDLFDPPPPPTFSGIAFVEFAVDEGGAASLAALLGRMGFRRTGRHRSKAVTLFSQGAINLVLNAEGDSFAHSYFLLHGLSVCALGLATADPLAAMSRAEGFACDRYEGRVGPNEWAIPAIRALDGSLVYFVPEAAPGVGALDTDFVRDGADATEPAGLDGFDHLQQALPEGQLDAWLLFHRAVLGLEPDELFVLADPHGLVRSRALASRNRAVRLPLNVSESRNTATARSVTAYAGAGVQHIAFATGDIFAAAAALRARGVALLAMPANHYDDLAARLDVSPELVARLRANHVLYDRAGTAEYFQLYTEAVEGRFCFEIVERRGGYDAYGAVNAPVRMAAQDRARGEAALP